MIKTKFPADFDLGTSLKSKFDSKNGRRIYRLSYKTHVVFGSKGSNLTFKTIVNGKVVSTADIVFDQS